MIASLQRYQVQLDRLQILQQQLERGKALQTGHRFEITMAGLAGLHLEQLSRFIRRQRAELPVIRLATIDAVEPLDLPVGGAASASEPTAAIQPPPLRQHRPGGADWAIAFRPVMWQETLELLTGGLEQRKRRQVRQRVERRGIHIMSRCQELDDLNVSDDCR